ncbi:MAG: hypoxanthine phosphoribosyltransferase [Bacillota bacterium]|nr:hypoxanthine phosphoribosyltransferase [Bacillota bacterium]
MEGHNVLISAEEIERRVKELAEEISRDYQGKEPLLVCVLKGGVIFLADLVRHLTVPVNMDFMAVSSYGQSTITSGQVRIIKDLDTSTEGRHVLLVEDIVDTGLTLSYLCDILLARDPASLKVCTLLDKAARRRVKVPVDYVGFEVPNVFLVGYGLDYRERYRELPYIARLEAEPEDG